MRLWHSLYAATVGLKRRGAGARTCRMMASIQGYPAAAAAAPHVLRAALMLLGKSAGCLRCSCVQASGHQATPLVEGGLRQGANRFQPC